MSLITITIEDQPDGTVKVVCIPPASEMISRSAAGSDLTSAEGYALSAINKIRADAKSAQPTRILIPRLGRA